MASESLDHTSFGALVSQCCQKLATPTMRTGPLDARNCVEPCEKGDNGLGAEAAALGTEEQRSHALAGMVGVCCLNASELTIQR